MLERGPKTEQRTNCINVQSGESMSFFIFLLIEVQVRGYLQGTTMTQKQVYPWKVQPNIGKGSWKPSALGLSCSVQAA